MAQLPFYNPPIPFLAAIPGGLDVCKKIIVRGTMTGSLFNINLQVGPKVNPRDDIALHISIRPLDRLIVRTILQNNSWGEEERLGGCPVQDKSYFTVQIAVKEHAYVIAVNGCYFCEFAHRMPYDAVKFIRITEGAQVDAIHCIDKLGRNAKDDRKVAIIENKN